MMLYSRIKGLYKENIHTFLRFAVVGVLNTCIDFLVFMALLEGFEWHYSASQVIGYTSGLINSFIWNRYWTFARPNNQVQTIPAIANLF
jgi:putative flippase GtrA